MEIYRIQMKIYTIRMEDYTIKMKNYAKSHAHCVLFSYFRPNHANHANGCRSGL